MQENVAFHPTDLTQMHRFKFILNMPITYNHSTDVHNTWFKGNTMKPVIFYSTMENGC